MTKRLSKRASDLLAVTAGEPAGIGPELCLALAGYDWSPDGSEIVLNEDFFTSDLRVMKILATTTEDTFSTDAVLLGRASGVSDVQPSWRP